MRQFEGEDKPTDISVFAENGTYDDVAKLPEMIAALIEHKTN